MTDDPSKDTPPPADPSPADKEPTTTEFDAQPETQVDLRPVTPAGAARERADVPEAADAPPARSLFQETAVLPGDELLQAAAPPAEDDDVLALRGVDFPLALRGYNTHAVDRYVAEVERSVARFEESRSPTAAVRTALDRVGEQTAAVLQEAERSAEETTASARTAAEDRIKDAEAKSAEIWTAAQARAKSLDEDIERLWQERQRLIDATRVLADQLRAAADAAEAEFPPEDGSSSAAPAA